MELQQFVTELKSRKVYRTAAVYCAGAWALLQVADVLFPVVGLPDWTVSAVLVLAALGFPLALVLSWLFELTPDGGIVAEQDHHHEGNMPVSRIIEFTVIIMLCGLVGYLYLGRLSESTDQGQAAATVTESSIAVMPFVNLSDTQNMEYLGDGLAEEILNLLARLTELDVAARTSSFYFKDKDVDILTIANKLGVGHVLEGSIRFEQGTVRVTAQLIEAGNGFHVWSETYDRELDDVLQLQDEIAAEVVARLKLILSPESEGRLGRQRSVSPEAYDYYLQANAYMRDGVDASNVEYAVKLYRKALASDEAFADAHAGLCGALLQQYVVNYEVDAFRQAEKSCQRALVLDRRAVTVYVALGRLYMTSGQHEQALGEFNTALALGADGAEAYLGMAQTYEAMGEPREAEKYYRTAIDVRPRFWEAQMRMAAFLVNHGRVEEAIPYYLRVSELMPDSEAALNNLGTVYFIIGDYSKASEYWRQSLAVEPTEIVLSNIATSLYLLGQYDEAAMLYHQALEYAPESHLLWGNMGDAYRHSAESAEMSAPMYQRAIELARAQLEVNPESPDVLSLVAHYYAALGMVDEARQYLQQAEASGRDDIYTAYASATAYTSLGEYEQAVDALARAVAAGYPMHIAQADANFADLHKSKAFKALATAGEN